MIHQDSPHPTPSQSGEAPTASGEAQQDAEAPETIDIDMSEALRRIRVGNEAWERRALAIAIRRRRRVLVWSAGILLLAIAAAAYLVS